MLHFCGDLFFQVFSNIFFFWNHKKLIYNTIINHKIFQNFWNMSISNKCEKYEKVGEKYLENKKHIVNNKYL